VHETWKTNSQGNTQPKLKTSMLLFYKHTHIKKKKTKRNLKFEDDNFPRQKKTKN
jgi:hypothetical protein